MDLGNARVQISRWASVQRIISAVAVIIAAQVLPLFDASPMLMTSHSITHTLRWDAFYFSSIARHDYLYEQHWAFFPGAPFIARIVSRLLNIDVLVSAAVVAFLVNPVLHLYDLTLAVSLSPNIARLVVALSLLPSSPATLVYSSYAEPFYTTISYTGMLAVSKKQYEAAALAFTLATLFRSNGVLLGGFILWDQVFEPFLLTRKLSLRRAVYGLTLALLPFIPFALYQYRAYRSFCQNHITTPEWCSNLPPLIYSYVQRKYWDVGFLRYWTLQQLPNFVIASPVYVLLLTGIYTHIRARITGRADTFFRSRRVTPHALHALFFTMSVLFGAHVQIMLRLAASLPFLYWSAAWLWLEHPNWGKAWVAWSACWGVLSIILWAAFLPPA